MVRETPFNLAHLRNMTAVTEMGGIVFPPLPAFYHRPASHRRDGRRHRRARAGPGRRRRRRSHGSGPACARLRPRSAARGGAPRTRRSGYSAAAAAAVVAAERQEQVAALEVEVVAQDHAAEAQVGLHVEQPARVAVADQARPERHHLHVAARAGLADGVLAEPALDLDQPEHQRRLEPGALALVPDGFEELDAGSWSALRFFSRSLMPPSQRR